MTSEELLARATAFDAGPKVHNCGWIIPDNIPVALRCHYFIELMQRKDGKGRWAITDGRLVMSKDIDDFIFSPQPSSRSEDFLADTRFDSVEEAFEFLKEWRVRELKRAQDRGYQVWPHDEVIA